MSDQNITELPVKTSSGITSSDYMLGIDSAEGYQMLIRDLGDYIIRNVQVNTIAGSNQTLKNALDTLNSNTSLLVRQDSQGTMSTGDVNTVIQTGNWIITNTANVEHIPSGLTGWWLLNVDRGYHDTNGNVLIQKLYKLGDSTQGFYMRGLIGTTWTDWVKQPSRAEVDALNSKIAVSSKLLAKNNANVATIYLPSNGRFVIFEMCNGANSLYAALVTVYSNGTAYKLDIAKGSEVSAELSTNTLTITSTPNVSFSILVMSLEPSISIDSITIS